MEKGGEGGRRGRGEWDASLSQTKKSVSSSGPGHVPETISRYAFQELCRAKSFPSSSPTSRVLRKEEKIQIIAMRTRFHKCAWLWKSRRVHLHQENGFPVGDQWSNTVTMRGVCYFHNSMEANGVRKTESTQASYCE